MAWGHWRGRAAIWVTAAAWAIVVACAIAPAGTARAQGEDDLARLLNEVNRLHSQGRYAEAVPIAKRAIAVARTRRGEQHAEFATAIAWLARLYTSQERYADAEPLYRRSLTIAEKALGPRHPEVASALNNLALTYKALGRPADAEPLYERCLAIREKALGRRHPHVAASLANLALLYQEQRRDAEAERLLERSLAIRESALGREHVEVGTSLVLLARLYEDQRRYAEAEVLRKRILAIDQKARGPWHPHTATALDNLARLYYAQGRYAEAEPLFKRSLAISERAMGLEHPEVGTSLNNLAELHRTQARYAEAEQLYKRSLGLREKVRGPDHPEVADSLNNLALLYVITGRLDRAEPLLKRSLAIREKVLGPAHPEVGASLGNLASLYESEGRLAEADPLRRRDLTIVEKALGPDHPTVATSLNNLAALHTMRSRYAEAEPLYRRCLALREKALGPDHPDVAQSLNNLALLYRSQGRYAEAEPLYRRALALDEKALGPDHPDIGTTLNNLAWLALAQNELARAAEYWRRSSAILQRRAERGLGGSPGGSSKGEAQRSSWVFAGLVKMTYRLAAEGRALGAPAAEMFETAQSGFGSEAAASLAQMAARSASGSPELAALVRERQDLVGEWQGKDKWLITAKSQPPERRNTAGEKALGDRLAAIDGRLAAIDARLARDFPGYAALSSPRGASVADMQAILRDDEALLLFLDTTDWTSAARIPLPEETFVWVVTKSDVRWLRSELGTAALQREVAALRCGLGARAWDGEGARRCADLLKLPPEKLPRDGQPLPFDTARAHALYAALLGGARDLIKGKHLLVVPSGALTTLPFQVLVTDGATAAEVLREVGRLGAELAPVSDDDRKLLPAGSTANVRVVRTLAGGPAEAAGLKSGDILLAIDQRDVATVPEAVAAVQAAGPGKSVVLKIVRDGRRVDLAATLGSITVKEWKPLLLDADAAPAVRWLVRDHAITVLPSAASLVALRRTGRPSAAARPMLGFANPLLDGDQTDPEHGAWYKEQAERARAETGCARTPRQRTAVLRAVGRSASPVPQAAGLADLKHLKMQTPLPETADEVCEVARSVDADVSDMRIGARATETEVKRISATGELARYRVLHFATHGLLAGQLSGTREPGLILTPPAQATPEDDGYLSGSEIAGLKLDADWVILSACNTASGAGKGEAAEALSGLARMFFYAGARALLVSHWEVDSDAAVKLVTMAVGALAKDKGLGRAEALRRAMLAAMADTTRPADWTPAWHPSVWAPFVVVGEGGAAAGQ
jgi:tetratricopeptide (TPR) repeat protein/CHAT domain-containing protein